MVEVRYQDRKHSAKDRAEISALRAERWTLFAALQTRGNTEGVYLRRSREAIEELKQDDERRWTRIQDINRRLFELTKNPIYDTEQ